MISECCGEEDTCISIDGPSYSDIGICPSCKEHCDFVDAEIDGEYHADLDENGNEIKEQDDDE